MQMNATFGNSVGKGPEAIFSSQKKVAVEDGALQDALLGLL